MVSTQQLMVSSMNADKFTGDTCYASSQHSADCDSGPWSACSSADMCTPMPHMTCHPINSKRYSHASQRSLTSATHMSTASSDVESTDYPLPKFGHPTTPPTLWPTAPNDPPSLLHPVSHPLHALYTGDQTWSTGTHLAPTTAQSSDTDGLHSSPSDHPSMYYPFTHWRPDSIGHTPLGGDYPGKAAPGYPGGDHSRSASYHSTGSSADSWTSHNQRDVSSVFSRPTGKPLPTSRMNHNDPNALPQAGMNMFPASYAGSNKYSNLLAAQASLEAFNFQNIPQDPRSLLDSLTPLPSTCANPQMGLNPTPLMDPQTLLAYNATFGASPLLYLHGLTPDLLAFRNSALAQLANAAALSQNPTPSASSVVDDKPNLANKKTNLYKTELCRSWEERGTCRYGSKCQFAHGQDDLKNVSRHPKFKTEVCRTFWLSGSCPYGKRCCFLHTTSTATGAPSPSDARVNKQAFQSDRNPHNPTTSRLQKRVSNNPLPTAPTDTPQAVSSPSPQLQPAPVARPLSHMSHSRSTSNSSCSLSSDGSSHIDSLRIQIWPRLGARDQVPAQDAPGPRSRLQRLRPSEDYADSPNSLPATSSLTATCYSPFVDRHQPPHSAYSEIPSALARSPSHHICKARSATCAEEPQWPMSRLPSSANSKDGR